MQPFLIKKIKSLKKLGSISPSRFTSLKRCALREVFSASGVKPMLPSSPKASLGNVCHNLLEAAGKGKIGAEPEDFEKEWMRQLEAVEKDLSENKLMKRFVPLEKHVNNYHVIKIRALKSAKNIAAQSRQKDGPPKHSSYLGHEINVRTPDGKLAGRIDVVEKNEGKLILADFKTGDILEDAEVKEEYKTQLMLYAAIFAEQHDIWPDRLVLIPMAGEQVEIAMEQPRCEELAEEARSLLAEIDEMVESLPKSRASIHKLGKVNPENCSLCPYRPCCSEYLEKRQSNDDWPEDSCVDIWGTMDGYQKMENGLANITLNVGEGSVSVIRKVHPDDCQLQIDSLPKGTQIAAFSLWKESGESTYTASRFTEIISPADID